MGLDVGDARIGVAVTDPLAIFAQPLCSIERGKYTEVVDILKLIAEHGVRCVVIGYPLELSGNEGPQAGKVRGYAERLELSAKQTTGLEAVEFKLWDERMTTVQAQRVVIGSGLKDRDRRGALDRIAATLILESYLQSLPNSGT